MEILLTILTVLLVCWFATGFLLAGPNLSAYDTPSGTRATMLEHVSPENQQALELLAEIRREVDSNPIYKRLEAGRRGMDRGIRGAAMEPSESGVEIVTTNAHGVPGEWVLAPNANALRRLLYIHGGGYAAGSPRSHRPITSQLSKLTGVSVLAIDYGLMPEKRRLDGIVDCQTAYGWIIENGPLGPGPAEKLFVAGDSAGGNLALMLIAWIRDENLRQVDAAIALSPTTDSTASSPSMRNNVKSDHLLGPIFGKLAGLPKPVVLLSVLLSSRMHPANPLISPVFGDLADLPPTLVQTSEHEMLTDDGRRWVNKAQSQGSDARLQTWPQMIHVWQIFNHILPEAREALAMIAEFINEHSHEQ